VQATQAAKGESGRTQAGGVCSRQSAQWCRAGRKVSGRYGANHRKAGRTSGRQKQAENRSGTARYGGGTGRALAQPPEPQAERRKNRGEGSEKANQSALWRRAAKRCALPREPCA